MRFLFALILLCLPTSLLADRVALVIGNTGYRNVPRLDNPINDSRAVSKALAAQGFEVLTGNDLGRVEMRETLRRFREMADKSDVALVYYAGHGIEIGGVNYLVPVDARLEDERDADLEMVDLDLVLRQISGASQVKMVVLDACRNNPFVTQMRSTGQSRNVGQGLGDIRTTQADTLIAYAAAAGAVTPDGVVGGNSPFTTAFLAAMAEPPADVRRVLGRVRDRMRDTVPGAAPFVYSSLGGGEYIVNPNSARLEPVAPVAKAEPKPEPAQVATPNPISQDFVETDQLATVAGWDTFLIKHEPQNAHPLYVFALQRRQALVDRNKAEQQRQADAAREAEERVKRQSEALRREEEAARDRARLKAEAQQREEEAAREREALQAAIDKLERENKATRAAAAAAGASVPAVAAAPAALPETEDAAARELQTLLQGRGCYGGGIDGDFGRGSVRGLASFLKTAGSSLTATSPSVVEDYLPYLTALRNNPSTRCPVRKAARKSTPAKATAPTAAPTTPAPQPTVPKKKTYQKPVPGSLIFCTNSAIRKYYDCD